MPLPLVSIKVFVYRLACHWLVAISPRLHEFVEDPGPVHDAAPAPNPTGVERPSTSMSFHWSNTVTLHVPLGRPERLKAPFASHLVNAKSSPSESPTLT